MSAPNVARARRRVQEFEGYLVEARKELAEAERIEALAAEVPTVDWGGNTYRLWTDSRWIERKRGDGRWIDDANVDYIAALASLLPRKPVEVTLDMIDRAWAAYNPGAYPSGTEHKAMRAALEAVAAELNGRVS